MADNADLRFDGPQEMKEPWPKSLVFALVIFATTSICVTLLWVGYALSNHEKRQDYGPITFASPLFVVDSAGVVPFLETSDAPPPSLSVERGAKVPILFERNVDCAAHDCPRGTMAVLASLRWEQLNTESTVVKSFPIVEDLETTYDEGEDYTLNTQVLRRFNSTPISLTDDMVDYIQNNGIKSSAWRVAGTTTPDRSDGVPASWTTEVIHLIWEGG